MSEVVCPDCRQPIMPADDDALVCIRCGGCNRRVEDAQHEEISE